MMVKSEMTGQEFMIKRSNVSKIAGDYISQADIDPTLTNIPVILK